MALLTCLVVTCGCSNIRKQSLELPLPVLPSESATASGSIGESATSPLLTDSDSTELAAAAESSVENASALDQSAFKNDFAASEFEQSPSVQNYLPSENDFQPQQPSARFVGLLDKAEMSEIKLTATTDKAAPAPPIAKASHEREIENCKTPEVCDANATAQCDCCKKNELPKFAVVEPLDPEQLPELFGDNRTTARRKNISPLQPSLRPLQATNISVEPIRLTAQQDFETSEVRESSESVQTQNKAQLLIPIAPAELQLFKADVGHAKTQATRTIKVSPIMDIDSAPTKTPITLRANTVVTNVANAPEEANSSKFIPVSTSGIKVSAVPFQSLPLSRPKPVIAPADPIAKSAPVVSVATLPLKTVSKPKIAPIKIAEPAEITKIFGPPKLRPPVTSNDFPSQLTISTKSIEKVVVEQPVVVKQPMVIQATQNEVARDAEQGFQVAFPSKQDIDDPNELVVASSSVDIDPLADLGSLPDMSQIERELAEFEKSNTFDPSTVIESDTIDPTVLLAKLDGPPKSIVVPGPVTKIVEVAPDNDFITEQLAAQSSALQELQDAVKQLKPKPVTVSLPTPELTLSNAAFCTKISGFGQFKPFAVNDFSGSQKTLLYCEVENQTSKQFTKIDGSQHFETVLHGSIVIYDANDQIVQTAKFPAIKDEARHRRRDFYVYFPVQFAELARGDYRLELTVEDASASKTAVLRPFMKFSIR